MSIVVAKPIQELITELENLPGIGPKSAARIAYYFLNAPEFHSLKLAESIVKVRKEIRPCSICAYSTQNDVCSICSDPIRIDTEICVVEEPLDVIAIENSNVFKGKYHVLGGVISPLAGIGPENLRIAELKKRLLALGDQQIELIIATNPTMEGEATAIYILDSLVQMKNVTISRIARGLPTGADIEYADYLTLKKSIENRVPIK